MTNRNERTALLAKHQAYRERKLAGDAARLRAENARLREALEALADSEESYRTDSGETTARAIDTALAKARAALKEQP